MALPIPLSFYAKKLNKKEIERKMVGNKITAKDIINSSVKVYTVVWIYI